MGLSSGDFRIRKLRDLCSRDAWREERGKHTPLPSSAGSGNDLAERRAWEPSKLSEEERRRILVDWNDTQTHYPRDKGIHELFEEQAERTPNAVAVVSGDRRLTYGELNRRANRLARTLRELGVDPDTPVAACLERSPEMLVGWLGVLKAGGAYMPLDPSYPAERLRFMLHDAAAPVLLVQEATRGAVPEQTAHTLSVNAEHADHAKTSIENPPSSAAGDNLAYVVYTSGSTGRPKGVCVPHRAVNRLVMNTDYVHLTSDDVVAQASNAAFDAATWEVWGALLSGARLVIVPQDTLLSAWALAAAIEDQRISALFLTTALFNQVARENPAAFSSLRHLLFGGEAVSPGRVRDVLAAGAPERLVHVYGPTETTTFATWYLVEDVEEGAATIPIGRPIANTTVYLLDAQLQPVPVGAAGELYIGGAGVARGYLNRPVLTRERFIPSPFTPEPNAWLYRTGDLARHWPDGNIEFLGRLDNQVKVRGFRVEPGEVEAALRDDPALRESVVVAREDEPGDKRLVAYVVPERGGSPQVGKLRHHLQEKLPDHMVPSAFVALETLPLTPNGKVDRDALPAPGPARPEVAERFVSPRTALEQFMARDWRDLLGLDRVGVHDDFFELGGDSIRAMTLLNRVQQALGEVVPMATIFATPTIAGLAGYLEQHYPAAVARLTPTGTADGSGGRPRIGHSLASDHARGLDAGRIAELRRRTEALSPNGKRHRPRSRDRNPTAIFVLSPPRSGSTLLRVILAGHSGLFAPPELELLPYATLAEKRAALGSRYRFWSEGVIRAIMALRGGGAVQAGQVLDDWERQRLPVHDCYRLLQSWAGRRTLVDKTTSYSFRRETLALAEEQFDHPRYVHLLRHPRGMVRSFEDARLDQVMFPGHEHSLSVPELAEAIWVIGHQNIMAFLDGVPAHRQHRLAFEELVNDPRPAVEGLCRFMGLAFEPEMLRPYGHPEVRMTDASAPGAQMLGDRSFHQKNRIEAEVADRWRADDAGDFLGDVTWELAESLGYQRSPQPDTRLAEKGGELPVEDGARARGEPRIRVLPRHSDSGDPAVFPLLAGQRQLWLAEQRRPGVYPGTLALRMRGPLDGAALEASLHGIAARHEALRTTFEARGGEPVQLVGAPRPVPLAQFDLRERPPAAREREAGRLLAREAQRPFDLAHDLMLRATLVRLGHEEHVLLVVVHHIACDAWSLEVLWRELGELYRARRAGERASLPELAVQYVDYAVWERERLSGGALAQSREYWHKQLAGAVGALDLAADRPAPAVRTTDGAWEELELPAALVAELDALGRRHGVTRFMTLLAAWAALLHRYSGQHDLVIVTPFANRRRSEVEELIGFFANGLLLRHDLSGDPSFAELLGRVRDTAVASFAHGDVPLEEVLEELGDRRPAAFFNLPPRSSAEFGGLQLERIEVNHHGRVASLSLFVIEARGGWRARLNYDPDRFEATTAAEVLADLRGVLASVAADAEQPIGELPIRLVRS